MNAHSETPNEHPEGTLYTPRKPELPPPLSRRSPTSSPYDASGRPRPPMISLDEYTPDDINELEKLIKNYKKSKKNLKFYKVTLLIGYDPYELDPSDCLNNKDYLEQFTLDQIIPMMEKELGLKRPEGVGGLTVEDYSAKSVPSDWLP